MCCTMTAQDSEQNWRSIVSISEFIELQIGTYLAAVAVRSIKKKTRISMSEKQPILVGNK